MGRLSGFSYRDITRKMRKLGFCFDRSGDLPEGTVRAILKQADINVDDFLST